VLNLNEQAKSLYGQLADFETRREIAEKDIIGYTAALKDIDSRFDPQDRRYIENALVKINSDIVATKQQLYVLDDEYVTSNFDETYKHKIDSLRNLLTEEVAESSDKNITNPLSAKQDLITQKLSMEISLKLAQNSVGSINKELDRLNRKFDGLVPHEAVIQSYENAIDVASREYLEILDKFNQTSLTSNFSIQLRQIQEGMPGDVLPSKKMLLTILSGIISFVFCVAVLFVLFYLDHSIAEPKELVAGTGLTVLGTLSAVKGAGLDLKEIWQSSSANKDVLRFRNELRAIRFEVDHEMGDASKLLTITSLKEGEGKTFLAISLAYAYAMTDKKILLIDGNFAHPSITDIVKPTHYLEDYLTGREAAVDASPHVIHLLGNRGGDSSLMEIAGKNTVAAKLQELKSRFDIIIIETAALSELDKSKEWIQVTDKVMGVFETGKTVTEEKKASVAYLYGLGKVFAGWVLNRAPK
jgi:Mrp family chromosome partitioning ATPase